MTFLLVIFSMSMRSFRRRSSASRAMSGRMSGLPCFLGLRLIQRSPPLDRCHPDTCAGALCSRECNIATPAGPNCPRRDKMHQDRAAVEKPPVVARHNTATALVRRGRRRSFAILQRYRLSRQPCCSDLNGCPELHLRSALQPSLPARMVATPHIWWYAGLARAAKKDGRRDDGGEDAIRGTVARTGSAARQRNRSPGQRSLFERRRD